MSSTSGQPSEKQHERAKVGFDEVSKMADENSKFIKIKGGQTVILKFDPEKMYKIEREFEGKKSPAIEYDVIEINTMQEKSITFSLSWAMNLNDLMKEGFRTFKITRKGESLDTSYTFIPVVSEPPKPQ